MKYLIKNEMLDVEVFVQYSQDSMPKCSLYTVNGVMFFSFQISFPRSGCVEWRV